MSKRITRVLVAAGMTFAASGFALAGTASASDALLPDPVTVDAAVPLGVGGGGSNPPCVLVTATVYPPQQWGTKPVLTTSGTGFYAACPVP